LILFQRSTRLIFEKHLTQSKNFKTYSFFGGCFLGGCFFGLPLPAGLLLSAADGLQKPHVKAQFSFKN
jgi:ABC-type uncharacterized transport system permease subunit